jgi:hypothetical protein
MSYDLHRRVPLETRLIGQSLHLVFSEKPPLWVRVLIFVGELFRKRGSER